MLVLFQGFERRLLLLAILQHLRNDRDERRNNDEAESKLSRAGNFVVLVLEVNQQSKNPEDSGQGQSGIFRNAQAQSPTEVQQYRWYLQIEKDHE